MGKNQVKIQIIIKYKKRTKIIFELWSLIIGSKRKESQNQEVFMMEFNNKRIVLQSILAYMKKQPKLTENIYKFIINLLIDFYDNYLAPPQEQIQFQIDKQHPEMLLAKIDLFQCLNCMSPSFYSSKINNFVQCSVENIFNFTSDDLSQSLNQIIDSQDLIIVQYSQQNITKFQLFTDNFPNSQTIQKQQEHILSYDQFNLIAKNSCNYIVVDLIYAQLEYIGKIMSSSTFTLKNKNNLLKYFFNYLNLIITQKDLNFQEKHIKIIPCLLVGIFVAKMIKQKSSNMQENSPIIIDKSMIQGLKQISEICWNYNNQTVKTLSSLLFAYLIDIKTKEMSQEELIKPLYENIVNNDTSATIISIIGYICKYNSFSVIKDSYLQFCNIFQKASRSTDPQTMQWLLLSVKLCIQYHQENAISTYKITFLFMILNHIKQQEETIHEKQLFRSLILELLTMLSKNSAALRKDPQINNPLFHAVFQQFLWIDVETDNQQYNHEIQTQELILIYQDVFKLMGTKNSIIFLIQKLQKLELYPQKSQLQLLQIIQNQQSQLNLAENSQIIVKKLNYKYLQYEQNDEIIQILEQLYLSSIEGQPLIERLQSQQNFIFQQGFIYQNQKETELFSEAADNNAEKQQKQNNQVLSRADLNQTSQKLRLFIVKDIENTLKNIDFIQKSNEERVQLSNYIVSLLYKIITDSNSDEIKLPIFRSILFLFKNLKKVNEQGELIKEDKLNYIENNYNQIMQTYAAQIDSIISQNLKNDTKNNPDQNIICFSLIYKFMKIMIQSDVQIIKKLVGLLIKPLFNSLRVNPSSFFSEKHMTTMNIKRLKYLTKIYFFIEEKCSKNQQIYEKLKDLFSIEKIIFIIQNIQALILDTNVILTAPRKVIRNYQYFNFIYNGSRLSYNSKLHFQKQTYFIKCYLKLSQKYKLESIQSSQDIDQAYQNQIASNAKALPDTSSFIQICFSSLFFLLSTNSSVEQEEVYLKKLTQPIQDLSILNKFMKQFETMSCVSLMIKQFDKQIINIQMIQEMLHLLMQYVDFSLYEFDSNIFEILTTIYENQYLEKITYGSEIVQFCDIFMVRYTECYYQNYTIALKDFLFKVLEFKMNIIKSNISQEDVSIDQFVYMYMYIVKENWINFQNDDFIHITKQLFKTCNEICKQMQDDEKNKCLMMVVINLIIEIFNQVKEQSNEKGMMPILYLFYYLHFESRETIQNKKFMNILAFYDLNFEIITDYIVDNPKILTNFSIFIRTQYQTNKTIDNIVITAYSMINKKFLVKIKLNISLLNEEYKNSLQEILKLQLLIFALNSYEEKIKLFEPFLRLLLLFIDPRFNEIVNNYQQDVIQLINQILKKIVSQIELQDLQKIAANFQSKLKQILQNILKSDPRILQAQQQLQNNQNKQQEQEEGQKGKIKLKMFGQN